MIESEGALCGAMVMEVGCECLNFDRNNKMKRIKEAYNRQSVPTRILISVLINLIIVVAVINITLFMQVDSIKNSQLDATSNFFDQYNQFALGQSA